MKASLFLYLLCFLCSVAFGQQRPQLTQYMQNNFLANPAVAGIEDYGDVRTGFRTQWLANVLVSKTPGYDRYTFQRNADNTGFATTDDGTLRADGSNAIPVILKNNDGNIIPTLGFIVEF